MLHISATTFITKCPEFITVTEAFIAKVMAASEPWLSENDRLRQ